MPETTQTETTPRETMSADELLARPESETATRSPDDTQLKAVLEAIVYVTEEPLSAIQIADAVGEPRERVEKLLEMLVAEFDRPGHGVAIREVAGGYKMGTKAEHHERVRAFIKSLRAPAKLSLPALETLAVIAYKQPVTAPEILEIRGVQGAGVLKTLLDRKLIATAGRKNVIGKPILYKTTKEFLVQFGLKDLAELPTLKEFEELGRLALDEPVAQLSGPVSESDDVAQVSGPVSESDVAQVSRPVSADEPEPPKPDGAPTEDEEAQASGPVPR